MRLSHVLGIFGMLALLPACEPRPDTSLPDPVATYGQGPALWSFEDDDSRVYLFGTIHLMRQDVDWFNDAVEQVFIQADSLTVEVDITSLDPFAVQQVMAERSLLPADDSLANHLPPRLYDLLSETFADAGIPTSMMNRWRPWFAALSYAQIKAADAGFKAQYGVDISLLNKARQAGVTIHDLERFEDQIAVLAAADDDDNITDLQSELDELENLGVYFNDLKDAWMAQDLAALDRLVVDETRADTPELYQSLFIDRNRAWLPKIQELLDMPGIHMVAVGAGHLVGEDSVIDMLDDQNIAVIRR